MASVKADGLLSEEYSLKGVGRGRGRLRRGNFIVVLSKKVC